MRDFFDKHQYLVVWILGLVIIGSLALLVIKLNQDFLPTAASIPQPGGPAAPTPTPAPSIALTLTKSGTKHTLTLSWQNLPGDTTALDIFRGLGIDTSTWELWQTLNLGLGDYASGSANFSLGASDLGYDYYVQAVGGGGANGSGNNSTTTLWTSNPTTPGTPTPAPTATPPPGQTPTPPPASTPTPTSGPNPTPTPTGSLNPTPTPTPAPNYNYYNPQVQGIGNGAPNGDFWVQHVNQTIEIGWQNLPANTDSIVVYRSQDQNGPWNQMLAEHNPGESGSSTITLVDGTLNDPYYYELTAFHGSTTLTTYGPLYLPPAGQ